MDRIESKLPDKKISLTYALNGRKCLDLQEKVAINLLHIFASHTPQW